MDSVVRPSRQKVRGSILRFIGMLFILHLVRASAGALFRYLGGSGLSLQAFHMIDTATFLVAALPLVYWSNQIGWSSVWGDRPLAPRELLALRGSLGILFVLFAISGALNPASIALNVKAALVVPVFEELLFRGVGWRFAQQRLGQHEGATWLVVALLFTFWHLGYADVLMANPKVGNWYMLLIMKLPIGLFFGLATGWLRTRAGRLEWPLLLHMLLNLFGA